MKTDSNKKLVALKTEINQQMQVLLNTVKPLCEPNEVIDKALGDAPDEDWTLYMKGSHFLTLRQTYLKIDELCNRVIEIQAGLGEKRIIL